MLNRINQKVNVYIQKSRENEIGELEPYRDFLKSIYCEIIPLSSTSKELLANGEQNSHNFRIRARYKSVKNISKGWELEHENNVYKVDYYNVDFKDRTFIEIFCTRIEE